MRRWAGLEGSALAPDSRPASLPAFRRTSDKHHQDVQHSRARPSASRSSIGQRSGADTPRPPFVDVAESSAMSFLKRLFGGADSEPSGATMDRSDPVDIDADERARDLELARAEQDRLDELMQR